MGSISKITVIDTEGSTMSCIATPARITPFSWFEVNAR